MKTKNKLSLTFQWAATIYMAMVIGAPVFAQPKPEESESNAVIEAFQRLDVLMDSVAMALKYAAPSNGEDDYELAMVRLELLAKKIETDLRYQAPDFTEILPVVYATGEKEQEDDSNNTVMSFFHRK